jgi:predicted dehydrogenase
MAPVDQVRIGIAGCGNQGRVLAEAVTRVPSLRLVAGADPIAAAAANVAGFAPDVRTYSSVEALLRGSEVDAVLVATPHHMLQPVALAAVRAGKHVMAEKPIALNEQQAEALQDAVEQKGVRFLSGYSFRFSFARHVRELLDAGVVGEVQALVGSIGVPSLDKDWISAPETGGGPLLFVGSHLVDLALWYTDDEPAQVHATMRRRADTGADETTALQIRFARGATAQLLISQAAPTFFFTLDVIGKQGRVTLRGWNFLHFEIEILSTAVQTYAQPTVIRPRIVRDNINAMFVPELIEFANAIREQREPSITVRDGRRALRVLDAAFAQA